VAPRPAARREGRGPEEASAYLHARTDSFTCREAVEVRPWTSPGGHCCHSTLALTASAIRAVVLLSLLSFSGIRTVSPWTS
jgi:hypothetical protein